MDGEILYMRHPIALEGNAPAAGFSLVRQPWVVMETSSLEKTAREQGMLRNVGVWGWVGVVFSLMTEYKN